VTRPDFSVPPVDLAALYSGDTIPDAGQSAIGHQLELPIDAAETEFRTWLLAQPTPEWMDVA
jgi:hypothetical protein